jgi:hypothetical protein
MWDAVHPNRHSLWHAYPMAAAAACCPQVLDGSSEPSAGPALVAAVSRSLCDHNSHAVAAAAAACGVQVSMASRTPQQALPWSQLC